MKTAVILSYKGLGANLLHLTYCHEIAKKFGPITIITLCKNLEEVLSKDPLIKEIIYLDKYYKKFLDIFNLSNFLKKLQLENIFIFYPSFRFFIASKIAKINNIYCYPLFKKKKLHLINAAKKFTCKSLNINFCPTETKIFVSKEKIDIAKKFFKEDHYNIIIGAGSSGPDTRWGEKNFITLINRLNEKGKYFFYIQCGSEQNEISKNIITNVKKQNCMDLSKMNIRETIPILYLCDMYVGNDSFSHHVTSQCNKPSIVMLLNSPKA